MKLTKKIPFQKIATGQGDDYTTWKFTGNLEEYGKTTIFFIIEEAKLTILNCSEGTVKVLWMF